MPALRRALTIAAAAAAILAIPALAAAQADYRVLHTFPRPSAPATPSSLIEGADGNFYGTTIQGGTANFGTIFKVTPGGVLTVLHEFSPDEGIWPNGLTLASDGSFYGTTRFSLTGPAGTIFRFTADGTLTVMHTFTLDEGETEETLVQGPDGDFYGTARTPTDGGKVYKITAAGAFSIVHAFVGGAGSTEPYSPIGPLILAADGNFYGTTAFGGLYGDGAFYRITPAGTLTLLHSFENNSPNANPQNLSLSNDGNFYGVALLTLGQTGLVRLTPSGDAALLLSFVEFMTSRLLAAPDGSLYGTSFDRVFRIAPDLSVSLLHQFDADTEGAGADVRFLWGSDANLHGFAGVGGPFQRGTVFTMTPAGMVTVLTVFPGDEQGSFPNGLMRAADGTFYGTTSQGGTRNHGTIFSIAPDGHVTWLHSFLESEGRNPRWLIQGADGYLYGVIDPDRCCGGEFAFRASTSGMVTLIHQFDPATEGRYVSLMQGRDGNFYGTATAGGEAFAGTVFRMTPAGVVTVLHAFDPHSAGDGLQPSGPLVQGHDGSLYGTSFSAIAGYVNVFKIAPDGSFSILHSIFSMADPYKSVLFTSLTLGSDGNLYGIVTHKDQALNTELFRITPDGYYTALLAFRDMALIPPFEAPDGNLYGTYSLAEYSGHSGVYKISLADGQSETLAVTGDEVTVTDRLVPGGDGYMYAFGYDATFTSAFVRLALPMPALMIIDAPSPSPTAIAQPFVFRGWALDLGPSPSGGTGIDAVHVWASPASGAAPVFVGAATYGTSRPDVAAAFGSTRFTASGFTLNVQGLSAGSYRLDAFAHSTRTGTFTVVRSVSVSIVVPPPQMAIDAPIAGAALPPVFTLRGWAIDPVAPSGTGIDAVHVYALPQSGGAPIFLGVAAYGAGRPDVGAIFGGRFTNSGFSLTTSGGLAPGPYTLVVFVHSTASGTFSAQTRDITIRAGNPMMFVDAPAINAAVSQPFTIRGWAVDMDGPGGTGVDAIHVWAVSATGTPVLLGAASYGFARPDVAAYLGASRFTNSGYSLNASGLSPGVWQLVVFAHSSVTGTFNQARVVSITIN